MNRIVITVAMLVMSCAPARIVTPTPDAGCEVPPTGALTARTACDLIATTQLSDCPFEACPFDWSGAPGAETVYCDPSLVEACYNAAGVVNTCDEYARVLSDCSCE